MFAGASVNQGIQKSSFQPSIIDTIAQQASISKQMPTVQASSRVPTVVMDAATETGTDNDSAYMDKVFLQQKYDNADHMDPDLHYTGNQYVEELM
jgi:hypothetical protein